VAADEGLWMHADAAYGGFFVLTERGRNRLRGIERSDSVTLDPHKGLFLPYGVGSLVVRDGGALRAAHYAGADYLRDVASEGELPNLSEYSIELSRDFRGLRVWLPLQLHGVAAFRDLLDEKLDLAAYLNDALRADPAIDVPWEPQLTVVPFRIRGGDDDDNRRFLERINASKRVFCSSTLLDGRVTIRACILNHRTHRDRIEEAIEIIGKAAAEA
jgi:aromatic-L-amino-acid decarboxylase